MSPKKSYAQCLSQNFNPVGSDTWSYTLLRGHLTDFSLGRYFVSTHSMHTHTLHGLRKFICTGGDACKPVGVGRLGGWSKPSNPSSFRCGNAAQPIDWASRNESNSFPWEGGSMIAAFMRNCPGPRNLLGNEKCWRPIFFREEKREHIRPDLLGSVGSSEWWPGVWLVATWNLGWGNFY